MDDNRANISQIQKYLNGELDAKAMHQLERQAQHDPFLMDALEGYGSAATDQQANITALQARLNERTATKTRRIIPWTVFAVAAAVAGFAVIAGLLYNNNYKEPQKTEVAMNQPLKNNGPDTAAATLNDKNKALNAPGEMRYAPPSPQSGQDKQLVFSKRARQKTVIAPADEAIVSEPAAVMPAEDSTSLDERVVLGYVAANKKTDSIVLGGDKVAITNNASSLTILKSKADGAMMKPAERSQNNAYELAKANLPPNMVTGVVLSRTDGLPLPGVSVKVVGKPNGTQTDVNGKFTLPNVKKDESLAFGYIGFNNKTLALRGKDSVKVELEGSSASLSEVVVTSTNKLPSVPKAHPRTGWQSFNNYLNNNAIAPNDIEGVVSLQFMVDAKGVITDVKVIKSLNADADREAIQLLSDGPAWIGNINGKPEVVKLKIKFRKKD